MSDTDPANPLVHTTEYYIKQAKLKLLEEIHRRIQASFNDESSSVEEISICINNTLSNIHKEHKLGEM